MPWFKVKDRNAFIATSYKVMSSTLGKQANLKKITKRQFFAAVILDRIGIGKSNFTLIVRDPYKRLESFYRDKILGVGADFARKGVWQNSVQILFPYIGIQPNMEPSEVVERVERLSFEDLISLLPEIYEQDEHLHLQCTMQHGLFDQYLITRRVTVKYDLVVKLESLEDVQAFATAYDLDLHTRVNVTSHTESSTNWSNNSRQIVNEVYGKDFDAFGYTIQS